MSAWTQLIANSSLSSGSAWQHLQNQKAGTGPGGVVIIEGLNVELAEMEFEAQIDDTGVAITVDDGAIAVVVDDDVIEVEIE